jgi:hypothetical protein
MLNFKYLYLKYFKDFLIIIFSIIVLFIGIYFDEYFKNEKIENKFILSLNENNFSQSLLYICKSQDLSLINEKNIFPISKRDEYKITKFFEEDKNTFLGKNYKIEDKILVTQKDLKSK